MSDELILSPMSLVEIRSHTVQRDDMVWRHHPDDVVVPDRESGSPFLAVLLAGLSTSVVQRLLTPVAYSQIDYYPRRRLPRLQAREHIKTSGFTIYLHRRCQRERTFTPSWKCMGMT